MLQQPAVDLSSCDREPIHILGAVQSFGFLLTVSYRFRLIASGWIPRGAAWV